MPDQLLAVMPAVGGRSSFSTMFDQPLAAIASRWRQEFLFHVCVKTPLVVGSDSKKRNGKAAT